MEFASQIVDNLGKALSRQKIMNDETKQDIWFKVIQVLQEKVIFNPILAKFEEIIFQSFNVLKNLAMNHPFDLEQKNYILIQKLFSDILFWQTFESFNKPLNDDQTSSSLERQKEETKQILPENEDLFDDLMQ